MTIERSIGPIPRPQDLTFPEWVFDVSSSEYLPPPREVPSRAFFEVLQERRSRRRFGPISLVELSCVLWYASKSRRVSRSDDRPVERRYLPSAGARHCIHTLITNWPSGAQTLLWYNPYDHSLNTLSARNSGAVLALTMQAEGVLAVSPGAILWHAAEFQKMAARYENSESLVWRDAGVLVCGTSLIAEALGLAACPLGVTGEPHLSLSIGSDGLVGGVGGCVVGGRID